MPILMEKITFMKNKSFGNVPAIKLDKKKKHLILCLEFRVLNFMGPWKVFKIILEYQNPY